MKRVLIVLIAAASLLVSCVTAAHASTRFHMVGTLHGTGAPDLACNGFRYATAGTLEGMPLGSVTWVGSECVDLVSNPGLFTIHGEFSLDDGLVTGTYRGHARYPDLTGRVRGHGTFSITGGSGVYSNAQGGGAFAVVAEPATGTAHMEFLGTVRGLD